MYPISKYFDEIARKRYFELGMLGLDDFLDESRYISLHRLQRQMVFNYAFMRSDLLYDTLRKKRSYNDSIPDKCFNDIIKLSFPEAVNHALDYKLHGGKIRVY